jgi:hypothetical protein
VHKEVFFPMDAVLLVTRFDLPRSGCYDLAASDYSGHLYIITLDRGLGHT